MKLYKALKRKKSLAGEIAMLRQQINNKNSFLEGSNTPEKFNNYKLLTSLAEKIDELIDLKTKINQANLHIQEDIYKLSELKASIVFFKSLNVREGAVDSYGGNKNIYFVQLDELWRDNIVADLQKQIDEIQDRLDLYNHTTDISKSMVN